jgi:glutathionylspermidine synthase
MRRVPLVPRPDWRTKVEQLGLLFHTTAGEAERSYWNESACYEMSPNDIDRIERGTAELWARCLDAAQEIIDHNRYAQLGIPEHCIPAITRSWEEEPPSIYGRFDLAYDGEGTPKMLEFNADTPTSLLEAAVVQWHWLEDAKPGRDQFNSIHERLIAAWKDLGPHLTTRGPVVHFAHTDDLEDLVTVTYLRDTAQQAGLMTEGLHIGDVGLREETEEFVDLEDRTITALFKLYPWEWMAHEEFGKPMFAALERRDAPIIMEPAWKMLLSNKGILAVLWELFPYHPNLLATTFDNPSDEMMNWGYVRKPKLSREGANVTLHPGLGRAPIATDGAYGEEGYICQALGPVPAYALEDGTVRYPIIGSWVIQGEPAGMGIRESSGPITDNLSQFVPHVMDAWFDPEQPEEE